MYHVLVYLSICLYVKPHTNFKNTWPRGVGLPLLAPGRRGEETRKARAGEAGRPLMLSLAKTQHCKYAC